MWLGFVLGLFFGVFVGIFLIGLCMMASSYRSEREWMPGNKGVRVPYKTEPRQ